MRMPEEATGLISYRWPRNHLIMGLLILSICLLSVVLGGLAATHLQMYILAIIGGVLGLCLYIVKPIWMISLSLAISPLLDQGGSHALSGIGFNLASVVRGASLLAMLFTMRNTSELRRANSRLIWGSVIFLIFLCISLPFAISPIFSLKQTLAIAYWIVLYIYLDKKLQTQQDAIILKIGIFLAGFIIIITMAPYEIHHVYSLYTDGSLSIFGPYGGGPFNLALSIAFWLPVFFILRSRKERIIYGILAILLLDILLHTFVRTALVAILIYLIYAILSRRQYRLIGLLTTAAMLITGLVFHSIQSGWIHRVHQSTTLNGLSSGRLQLYQVAIQRFVEMDFIHKLIGIGFGNASVVMIANGHAFHTDPQNDFLNTLLSAGTLGLIGLIIYLTLFFLDILRITNKHHRSMATMVFFTIFVIAMINGIYSGESTAMVFAITTIGLARYYAADENNAYSTPAT